MICTAQGWGLYGSTVLCMDLRVMNNAVMIVNNIVFSSPIVVLGNSKIQGSHSAKNRRDPQPRSLSTLNP